TMAAAYIAEVPGLEQLGGQSWANAWAFVLLILVLLFRPQGIMGERVADRA
ncbi:branched-chain amino acid ABC transporter permease, partial [Streptomyces sp. SID8455]|nr:branched-chain amino acid ABC transporter permease [Streptomyces sp. SID8455]